MKSSKLTTILIIKYHSRSSSSHHLQYSFRKMNESEIPLKEGILRKRGEKLQRFSARYFILYPTKLVYKIKQHEPVKNVLPLASGCKITDVIEDVHTSMKGSKKLYSFWIIWPHDKHTQSSNNHTETEVQNVLSNDESDDDIDNSKHSHKKEKLKRIIETEVRSHKQQQMHIEKEIENHKVHDGHVRLGTKVAAMAAAGGVLVGVLTAGIGLVPYFAVVGAAAAAAGGGAVIFNKLEDSRVILAADSYEEAMSWKSLIQTQINNLDRSSRPMLASAIDARKISMLIEMCQRKSLGIWKCISYHEGMRILEYSLPVDGTRCCRAQVVVNSVCVNAFLSVMEGNHWPKAGTIKVDKMVDDHADIISVTVHTKCQNNCFSDMITKLTNYQQFAASPNSLSHFHPSKSSLNSTMSTFYKLFSKKGREELVKTREVKFSRFWKLDEEGAYLITLNTVSDDSTIAETPSIDAVISISPRKDHIEFDDELPSALVSCICQVSSNGDWQSNEINQFITDFMCQQLLDLKCNLQFQRFGLNNDLSTSIQASVDSPTSHPTTSVHRPPLKSLTHTVTTQPGLEDTTIAAYNHHAAYNSAIEYGSLPLSGSSTPTGNSLNDRQKKSIFSRSFTGKSSPKSDKLKSIKTLGSDDFAELNLSNESEVEVPTVSPHIGNQNKPNASPQAKVKSFTRFSSNRKSFHSNAEATQLRQQIASKEYGLERLEKLISKRTADNLIHSGSGHDITLQSQQFLVKELKQLKAEYLTLTGTPYEDSVRKRGTISRTLRSLRGAGNNSSVSNTAVVNTISSNVVKPAVTPTSLHVLLPNIETNPKHHKASYPSHWNRPVR